jgi:cellulose synthase operon protein C
MPSRKLRRWLALGIAATALAYLPQFLSSRSTTEREANLRLERSRAHLASGDFERARIELRAALRLEPGNGAARRELAELELRLGDWELAFLEFQSLTQIHPQDPEGWIGLASLMVKSGLLEAPEAALDKAIAAAPGRADARWQRGEIRFRLGRYYGSNSDAQAAVELAPSHVPSWVLLVRSAARLNGVDAGMEAARLGIAAVGRDPELLLPLSRLLSERGRTLEALRILDEVAASGAAGARHAQLSIAALQVRSGKRDLARRKLDALLAQHPMDEDALALRALLHAKGGEVQPSLARLEAALEALPSSRTLRIVHARLRAARDDPGAVAALLAEMTGRELGPAPAPPSRLRGEGRVDQHELVTLPRERWPGRLAQLRQALEVQMRQQNWSEAQRLVDSARRTYPESAFGHWLAGILELARGDAEAAEKHLREASAAAPRAPTLLVGLAKAWSRQKGAAFAGEQLMQLAERDPSFAFARYLAAQAHLDARDPARAEAALRRGLELQPDSAVPYQHLASHYLQLELGAEALAACHEGLSRFPDNIELRLMLARMNANLGKSSEAISIYEDILSTRPDLDLVAYKLAMLLALQGGDKAMWARSMQIAQRLQGDAPSDPSLLATLGWVRFRAQDMRRARELLEAAVRGAPEDPALHFHLAAVYAEEKNMDLARNQLKYALESDAPFPQRLEALRLLRQTGG